MPPIPMAGYLVPESTLQAPEGFTVLDQPLTTGLPCVIALGAELQLTLVLATGLASFWRKADPYRVVSTSADELSIVPAGAPRDMMYLSPGARLRLLLQVSGATVASVPVTVGLRRLLPEGGAAPRSARIELFVLGWDLHVGTVLGSGDFGSHLTLAWRFADQATPSFILPPLHPYARRRLVEAALSSREWYRQRRSK